MAKKQVLELASIPKGNRSPLEPHILINVPVDYHADADSHIIAGNAIFGVG